jgi:ribosomal protein S18 acetylase RimI-like enzyme
MNRSTIGIRPAMANDVEFLWVMLTYAASMTPVGEASVAAAQADPFLQSYVEGWGRPGDVGVVAATLDGSPLGAAWVRRGLKLAEPDVPELATAVVPEARNCGIGTLMMNELIRLTTTSFRGIILSVRKTNPAVRFYERMGFRRERDIRNRVGGLSVVMRRTL